nr:putative RNA-dependent RNA polymerase [Rhizoctonia solani mitovirus 129]
MARLKSGISIMIITLILITAGLSLVHYLGAEELLVYVLALPLHYYLAALASLVILRVALAVHKYLPVIRRLFRSLERVSNNSSAILQRLDRGNSSNGSKGSARQFSTSAVAHARTSSRNQVNSFSVSGVSKSTPLSGQEPGKETLLPKSDLVSAVRTRPVDVNAMSIVKDGSWWVGKVIRLLPSIGMSVTGPRVRAIVVILRKFSCIAQTQGIRGLVIHLKAAHVCLTQALGSHKIKDTGGLGPRISRTNTGLPRLILAVDRKSIREGNTVMIKFYQTLFGMYRVLSFKGKLKYESITSPFKGKNDFIFGEIVPMVPAFTRALWETFPKGFPKREEIVSWKGITKVITLGNPAIMDDLRARYAKLEPIWLAKSAMGTKHIGPEGDPVIEVSSHPFLMIRTAVTIFKSDIYSDFRKFLSLFPVNSPFEKAFNACLSPHLVQMIKPLDTLGKLGLKEEAAGKVRVFAMVPTWFQNLMSPLHELLFSILSGIPQDGTFDQLGPLRNHTKYDQAFSLDLTAATDRLPLSIQTYLLAELTGSMPFAMAWANLLTKIEYTLKSYEFGIWERLTYAVGQPMGALSSWAMLAYTHHFLVQVSAWRSGVTPQGVWFRDYAVLGDDLVIFNRVVANEYIKVIRNIGMEIGLHKSVLSRHSPTLEFAKRIFHKGKDVSAVPFKEFFASLGGFGQILEFARKYNLSKLEIAKTLGFRFKALSKVNHGFSSLNYKLKQLLVASSLPTSSEAVVPFLMLGSPKMRPWQVSLQDFFRGFSQYEFKALLRSMQNRHKALLNSRVGFFHLDPDLRTNPLLGYIVNSSKMHVVGQNQVDWNWYKSDPSVPIEGPAESKEDWSGFVIPKPSELYLPGEVHPKPLRSVGFPDVERQMDLTAADEKALRLALAELWDFQILPLRTKLFSQLTEIQSLLVKNYIDENDLAKVFIAFLDASREAALLPKLPVNFQRVVASSRSTDPVSIRIWKRWSKYIQGTVHGGMNMPPVGQLGSSKSTNAQTPGKVKDAREAGYVNTRTFL